MTKGGYEAKEKCLKALSQYRDASDGWKAVPKVVARKWRNPFADGGDVERRRTAVWHVSDTGEV